MGNEETLINDEVGGHPILVVFNMEGRSGIVFSRKTEEGDLTFTVKEGFTFTDAETGSTWDGQLGLAIDGPLEGTRLERVMSTKSFWFGWKDFYPETRVYGEETGIVEE